MSRATDAQPAAPKVESTSNMNSDILTGIFGFKFEIFKIESLVIEPELKIARTLLS